MFLHQHLGQQERAMAYINTDTQYIHMDRLKRTKSVTPTHHESRKTWKQPRQRVVNKAKHLNEQEEDKKLKAQCGGGEHKSRWEQCGQVTARGINNTHTHTYIHSKRGGKSWGHAHNKTTHHHHEEALTRLTSSHTLTRASVLGDDLFQWSVGPVMQQVKELGAGEERRYGVECREKQISFPACLPACTFQTERGSEQ